MKKLFFLSALLTTTLMAQGQTPNWIWTKGAGSSGADVGNSVVVDGSGNSYVTGSFNSSITFGTVTLTSSGNKDFFVVKYDASGNVLWAKNGGGSNAEEGRGIAVDANGNVYVTGYFQSSSITLGTATLTNSGLADFFIVKYDASGNVVWAKSAGSSANDAGNSIAVDGSGNSYVTGYFGSSITFGATTLINAGGNDVFLVKYDAGGNVVWTKSAGGSSSERGQGIALDAGGNIYITGYSSGYITFGTTTLTSAGSDDVFVVKYDAAGNVVWAKGAGGSALDDGNSIAVDGSGNVYVTGFYTNSSITFGTTTLTNAGGNDVFLVKYDANGNVVWAKSAGGSNNEVGWGLAVESSGNSYITGHFESSSISFGTTTLSNAGSSDIFVVMYDASGNVVWAKSEGNTGSDWTNGIAVDGSGTSYVTGAFLSSAITFNSTTLTNAGSSDFFIAKLGTPCSSAPPQPGAITGAATPCSGTAQNYSVTPVTGAASYSWTLPSGWTGSSTANSVNAIVGTTGGNITVSAINSCGTSPVQTFSITSVSQSPTPTITQSGNTVSVTSSFSSYQWYFNSNPIAGATNQNYTATQSGNYYVLVTDGNNCSGQSNILNVIVVGLENISKEQDLLLYPNPNKGVFIVKGNLGSGNELVSLEVLDITGRVILKEFVSLKGGEIDKELKIKNTGAGVYLLRLSSSDKIRLKPFTIE